MNKPLLARTTPAFGTALRDIDEMQNRLRRFFGPATAPDLLATENVVGWMPAVEIVEQPDALLLTAELPGLARENIDVSFEDDVLTIRGEKKEEKKEEKAGDKERMTYHLVERSYGAFSRSFVMPRTIDPTKISADFEAGVLKVRLPKLEAAQAKGRKIEVKAK